MLTSALPAIAAALALLSTPALAQQVQPAPTDTTPAAPTTIAPATTAPAVESAPAALPTPTTSDTASTATESSTTMPTRTTRTVKHTITTSKQVSTAAAAPVVHKMVHTSRAPTTPPLAPAPAEVPPVPAAAAAPPAPAAPPTQIAPATRTAAAQPSDHTALEVGGAILALLIIGGAAYAVSRRRRGRELEEDDYYYSDEPAAEEYAEPTHEAQVHEQVASPVAAAESPSAFAWGNPQPVERQVEQSADDDRLPGETWVERAYRGPSANNPSLSLRKRLKRASFFDMKERQATGGEAAPTETAREDQDLVSA